MPHRHYGRSSSTRRAVEPAAEPAAPLAERTNAQRQADRAPRKLALGGAAAPPPPRPPPPVEALPGLAEDGLPISPSASRLLPAPAGEDGAAAYGCAFSESIRVSSIARSAKARKTSSLRLVLQPSPAEGRAAQALPPAARLAMPLRTQALKDGSSRRSHSGSRGSSRRASGSGSCSPSAAPALPADPEAAPEQHSEEAPPPLPVVPGAARHTSRSQEEAAPAPAPAAGPVVEEAAPAGSPQEAQAPAPMPAPATIPTLAPVGPQEPPAEAQPARGRGPKPGWTAVYSGVPAEEEAAGLPSQAAPPRWLAQQGSRQNRAGTARSGPAPLLSLHGQAAAEQWRAAWLTGLQWHNAWRSGAPLRAGSAHTFIPLDAGDALMELFCFHTSVMPEQVVAGAARFQDLALADPGLSRQALEEGVLRFGTWGVPNGEGGYTLLGDGQQLALPMSFRSAGPRLRTLFLACVWQEANSAEAAHAACYTFTADAERRLDERGLAYPVAELDAWARWALGAAGEGAAAEAAVEALHCLAVFGAE